MARTISEIYNAMIVEKESNAELAGLQPDPDSFQTFLADLTTASKMAIWRLIFYVVALAIYVHEVLWDAYRQEVEDRAEELIPGTLRWYYEQCLIFQYGDGLSYIDGIYQYFPVNEANRIIERAAAVEVGDQVQLKVAKLDGSGLPTPLLPAEIAAFEEFVDTIKFAGTNTLVISEVADLLKVVYTIFYDPLVLAADGSLLSDPATFPVEDAITGYIQDMPFNGVFFGSKMEDAIQGAVGVVGYARTALEAKYGALPYSIVAEAYGSNAGHMDIDPAFPLSANLTYSVI